MLADAVIVSVVVLGCAFLLGHLQRSRHFHLLILGYGAVLSIAILVSLSSSHPLGDGSNPYLMDSDGTDFFEQARALANRGIFDFREVTGGINYVGYQLFLAFLFQIFGTNLVTALIANCILLLLAMTCLYRATFLMTGTGSAAVLACSAFALTSINIFYALVLLKEPAITLAFALILLAVAKFIYGRGIGISGVFYLCLALAIIVTMRGSLLLFVFLLVAFLAGLLLKRRGYILAVVAAGLVLLAPLAQSFTVYGLDTEFFMTTIMQNRVLASRFEAGDLDLGGVAGWIAGEYMELSFIAKIMLFPVPVGLQILLPFDFWSDQFLTDHFASFFAKNLNPLWYLFVFIWVAYAIIHFRKIHSPLVRRFLLAGVFYYVVVAVIYNGLIPRYGVPALIFIYPAVGYWWARSRADAAVRASARRFFELYYGAAVLLALVYVGFQLTRG